jgi:outer membrane protein
LNFGPALLTVLWLALPALAQEPATSSTHPPTAAAPTAAPVTLTLAGALTRALQANPGVAQSRAEVTAAQALSRQALSSVLPKIGVQGNFTRNDQEVTFGSGADARTILAANDWSYRVTLNQPVYAGNRERKALQQSRLNVENARQGVLSAEDQLLLGVAADYLGVVEAESLTTVEERNLDLARRRRDQAQVFFDAGETTRVDVLRAEADIKGAERRLATARQAREAAVGRLRLDLALEAPIAVQAPGKFLPPRPAESELVAAAQADRPEVRQARTNLEIARLEVGKQKGAVLPTVTADGAWVKQRAAFPTDEYGQLSLRLSIPIFDSGEIRSKVVIAEERRRQAELALQQARQAVGEEVHQALVSLDTAEANLRLAQEQLAAAEAEYDQAAELYRAQELTALEAESAETSLADARRTVASSQLDRDLAELRVWAAAGRLKTSVPLEGAQ